MTQWGVDTLFNPAKRHMDEEKQRLQSTRAEVGDSSGGKRIDLESGKVVIHRAGAPVAAEAVDHDLADGAEAVEGGAGVGNPAGDTPQVDAAAAPTDR
jgi:hypothetical protein